MSKKFVGRVAVGTAVTVLGVIPPFLTGALGVVLRPSLGLSAIQLGALVAGFWAAASVVAVPAGIAMRRVSGRRAMAIAALSTTVGAVTVATSRSVIMLAVGLVLSGAASALCQLAAAKYLVDAIEPEHLGLALGVKQAALPAATLVGGLAVPLAVGHIDWPVLFAVLAVVAFVLGARMWPGSKTPPRDHAPVQPRRSLRSALLFAVVAGLASVGATGMSVFVVEFVDSSVGGVALGGYMLAVGSALAVAMRVALGAAVDRGRLTPVRTIGIMLAVGASSAFIMPWQSSPWSLALVVAALYGVGWGWSGLVMYEVAGRAHSDVAAATGTMQTGVWIGSVLGPLLLGAVIDHRGFAMAWTVVAGCLALAALILAVAAWFRSPGGPAPRNSHGRKFRPGVDTAECAP